jgi:hypothetical protein
MRSLRAVEGPAAGLVLGHGAAGGVGTVGPRRGRPAANQARAGVALVEQPYQPYVGCGPPLPGASAAARRALGLCASGQIIDSLRCSGGGRGNS